MRNRDLFYQGRYGRGLCGSGRGASATAAARNLVGGVLGKRRARRARKQQRQDDLVIHDILDSPRSPGLLYGAVPRAQDASTAGVCID